VIIIRKIVNDSFENCVALTPDEWRLREQVDALTEWLTEHRTQLDQASRWVADIGFRIRKDAAGGGPPITRELMQMCLESNLEIWLSEYPGQS
jgi:hypothetical protein